MKYRDKSLSVALGGSQAFRDHYDQTFGPRCYCCDGRKDLAVVESVELGGKTFKIHACRKCRRRLKSARDRFWREMEGMMP